MDKPRVMVLIQEIRKGESKPTYNSAVTAILDYLTEKEFNMVDPAQVAAMLGSDDEDIAKAAAGDPVRPRRRMRLPAAPPFSLRRPR